MSNKIYVVAVATILALALGGCAKEKGPMEKMGESMDEAAQSVEESAEDVAESIEEAVNE